MTSALEISDLTRQYHPAQPPAVDGVSLTLPPGEIFAMVGESGSGKSTLLRLICGLEKPDGGRIFLEGRPLVSDRLWVPPEKRQIGMVFQDGALFPHLTVAENIAYGLRPACRRQQCQRIETLLCLVGMDGFQTRYPHELSGGERQRLAVIRALAPEPSLLLLDEPFSSLDPSLRRQLRRDITRMLRELQCTVIMVTHDTDDALHVGDRVAVLRQGKFEQIGTPQEVYHFPANAHSARLFGEANEVGSRWVRPEDLELIPAYVPGAHPVMIEEIHNAGRHLEIRVRPQDTPSDTTWVLYDAFQTAIQPGAPAWVRFKDPLS